METIRVPVVRTVTGPLVLFVGSGAALALLTAWLLWVSLPYERFLRVTAAERFLFWEGVVWLIALVLGFLGLAAVLQVVGWNVRSGVAELLRRLQRPGSEHPLVSTAALASWWMMAYSVFLMLAAALARSLLAA